MKLDTIDKRLLSLLQNDSKVSIKQLSAALNITKTPIYERIKRYEREGIIEKYVAVIDHEKIGESMVIFCSVSLESQKLENIEAFNDAVMNIPEVLECYFLAGTNDFLLKVVVANLKAYHYFSTAILAALPNIRHINSTFVLNRVKHSTVFPV